MDVTCWTRIIMSTSQNIIPWAAKHIVRKHVSSVCFRETKGCWVCGGLHINGEIKCARKLRASSSLQEAGHQLRGAPSFAVRVSEWQLSSSPYFLIQSVHFILPHLLGVGDRRWQLHFSRIKGWRLIFPLERRVKEAPHIAEAGGER